MEQKQFLDYIEDKTITIENDWFFHATDRDITTIEKILNEGIKCASLRKEKSQHGYNGKYYISVSKKTNDPQSVYLYLIIYLYLYLMILIQLKQIVKIEYLILLRKQFYHLELAQKMMSIMPF